MISILASPKPWKGIAELHQYNAVRSWLALHPNVEIILYGDAPGTAKASRDLGVQHVPDIAATPEGVPYFGAITDHAAEHARYDHQCYVNCDILFTRSLMRATQRIPFGQFLIIGQRIDLAEGATIDVTASDFLYNLTLFAETGEAEFHPPAGSDYFLFPRGLWQSLPTVVIGRGGYDNALISYCLQRNIPVIDASYLIMVIHQYHNYNHVQEGEREIFQGIDANANYAAIRSHKYIPTLLNANYVIKAGQLKNSYCRGDWLHFMWSSYLIKEKDKKLYWAFYFLWRGIRKLGLVNEAAPSLRELIRDNTIIAK